MTKHRCYVIRLLTRPIVRCPLDFRVALAQHRQNYQQIKVDITYLSFQILAKHRQDQRGHPRLELAQLTACQLWQTTPPSFRMERRTFVYTRCIPYPLIERQEAILLGYPCLETKYEIMGVIFVRNNPNFPVMTRLESIFVWMRKSYLFRACFTLPFWCPASRIGNTRAARLHQLLDRPLRVCNQLAPFPWALRHLRLSIAPA